MTNPPDVRPPRPDPFLSTVELALEDAVHELRQPLNVALLQLTTAQAILAARQDVDKGVDLLKDSLLSLRELAEGLAGVADRVAADIAAARSSSENGPG